MKYQMDIDTDQTQLNFRFSSIKLDGHDAHWSRVTVVVGMETCAEVLQSNSETVLLCLLPKSQEDNLGLIIQQKLVAAFCMENDIELRDVNDVTRVPATLSQLPANNIWSPNTQDWTGLGCILVCKKNKQDLCPQVG